jgi:hypothetical protein
MVRPNWRRQAGAILLVAAATWAIALPGAVAERAGAQSSMSALSGQGVGVAVISPTSALQGTFDAHVAVAIHSAAPNTTFTISRAVDFVADGVCTGTVFVPVATLVTSSGGAGAVEFERIGGPPPGTHFDLLIQAVGDGTVLDSGCMTITVK